MKRLALISCVAVLAFAQSPIRHGDAVVSADQKTQDGPVRHLIGHVTFETDAFRLQADQVDLNDATAEIVARGDVRIKLK
jgi:lipopolysaccharide assembly outer membrane protein LptD (OstA)